MMDLLRLYNDVNAVLEKLDFELLDKDFRKYRFALYTGSEIAVDNNIIPWQDEFRGNTAILFEGEYIAIWNIEFDPVDDPEMLAYCIVHEMYHCHQRTLDESRYPSDFALLNYPDDADNYNKKYNENRYLADAYQRLDIELLRSFAFVRDLRMNAYPNMVCQELKAETCEGMAEYVGLKALRHINAEKFLKTVNKYIGILREESNMIFDIRRISYYSGAIFFLCLEELGIPVRNVIDSELTAYEQNPVDIACTDAEIREYDFISANYSRLLSERISIINDHIHHAEYIASDSFICGYDPMNMFRVGSMIYCSHFVYLNENGEINAIMKPVVIRLADGSDQRAVGYYI